MNQGKLTLFFLIFSLACVGSYLYLNQHVASTKERQEKQNRVFEKISAEQVRKIHIALADHPIDLIRKEGRWLIEKPIAARANDAEVANLLNILEYLELRRRVSFQEIKDSKNTLDDYGLEKPKSSIVFTTDQGEHQVELGHETRQGDAVYARVDREQSVILIPKTLPERLEKPLEDWRNKAIFDVAPADVARLEIRTSKRVIELAKQNDLWRIVQPLNVRASTRVVEDLVDSLANLQADQFVTEENGDLKKYKLDEPQIELTLRTSKAGDPGQVLLIGAPIRDNPSGKPPAATAAVSDEEAEPGAGAQRHPAARWSAMRKGQPTIFAIGEKSIESLRPDLKEFRDEQLFHVDRRDVQSVVIQQSGGSMRIEKSGDGWKWAEPQSGGVDAELMDRFLSRTLGTKIQEFTTDVLTDVDRYGLADGAPVLRFYGAKNEKGEPALLGAIRLGSFNSKRTLRYVKREDESSIYGASAEDLKFIPASPLDLRDRVFLKILRDAARQISLRTSYGSYVLERSPRGEWTASGGLVDRGAVDRLLSAVSRLSAIRLVSENEKNPEAKYGLDRRAAELTIIEKNGEDVIRHELLVGETSSGPAYVYYRNKGLVAEIPHAIADDLTAPLLKKPSS